MGFFTEKLYFLKKLTETGQNSLNLGKPKARFWLGFKSKKLGLARLAISCKNSSVQLGLLYHLKNELPLKTKNELISNIFANFLRYNPEDINKSAFFHLKSCIL